MNNSKKQNKKFNTNFNKQKENGGLKTMLKKKEKKQTEDSMAEEVLCQKLIKEPNWDEMHRTACYLMEITAFLSSNGHTIIEPAENGLNYCSFPSTKDKNTATREYVEAFESLLSEMNEFYEKEVKLLYDELRYL